MRQMLQVLIVVILLLSLGSPALAAEAVQDASPSDSTTPILSFSLEEIIILGLVLANLGVILLKSKPQTWDTNIATELRHMQENRDSMERLERAHQESNRLVRDIIGATSGIVGAIAPYTRIKVDDAVADWLDDVRTPGAPDDLQALAARGYKTVDGGKTFEPVSTAAEGSPFAPRPGSTFDPQG